MGAVDGDRDGAETGMGTGMVTNRRGRRRAGQEHRLTTQARPMYPLPFVSCRSPSEGYNPLISQFCPPTCPIVQANPHTTRGPDQKSVHLTAPTTHVVSESSHRWAQKNINQRIPSPANQCVSQSSPDDLGAGERRACHHMRNGPHQHPTNPYTPTNPPPRVSPHTQPATHQPNQLIQPTQQRIPHATTCATHHINAQPNQPAQTCGPAPCMRRLTRRLPTRGV